MTEPTPQMKWAQNLAEAVVGAGHGSFRPARHVLARLATLLTEQDVKYVDVDLRVSEGSHGYAAGTIAVFTDTLVALVAVNNMLVMPSAAHQTGLHEPAGVTIRIVPRRSLRSIAMLQDGDNPRATTQNDSADWQTADFEEWPYSGRVTVEYDGLDEPIVMPSGKNHSEFQQFLPELLVNLNR